MIPPMIRQKRDQLATADCQVRWCDDHRLEDENIEGVAPGGFLNVSEWFVVGTTVGGNAVVVRADEPAVYFADHTWYADDDTIDYQDFSRNGEWVSAEFTEANVRRSLCPLASSIEEFVRTASDVDKLLDTID